MLKPLCRLCNERHGLGEPHAIKRDPLAVAPVPRVTIPVVGTMRVLPPTEKAIEQAASGTFGTPGVSVEKSKAAPAVKRAPGVDPKRDRALYMREYRALKKKAKS